MTDNLRFVLDSQQLFDVQLHYNFRHHENINTLLMCVCVYFSAYLFVSPTILATCELMLSCKQYNTTLVHGAVGILESILLVSVTY